MLLKYQPLQNAENEEGIFRLSGSTNVIRQLKERFDAEGDVNLLQSSEFYDVHAVAGLLKQYLRDLPPPLLTRTLQPDFLRVIGESFVRRAGAKGKSPQVRPSDQSSSLRPAPARGPSQCARQVGPTASHRRVHALPLFVSVSQPQNSRVLFGRCTSVS